MNGSGSIAKSFAQRIGVFVDVQNMFYSAKLLHQSKLDYGKLLREIVGDRQLIRAIAYIVQKPEINQTGFHEALTRLGYELRIKELRIRQDSDGGRGSAKGDWNVGLTVNVMSMANRLDTIALVSGDGDFTPLAEALKLCGCRVEVYSFERSTAGELIKAADQYIPIQDDWIFKEKKFEKEESPIQDSPQSALGSTASGEVDLKDLPKDEDAQPTSNRSKFGILS
jgi:uncharacterized LabA/DUF88 family protein